MYKIRRGKDFKVIWSFFDCEGNKFLLSRDLLSLYIENSFDNFEVTDFSVEENKVIWIFKGKDQKILGDYTLRLVKNNNDESILIDEIDAFSLVLHSHEESSSCECGNINIEDVSINSELSVETIASLIIDTELSETSHNAVANHVITGEFKRLNEAIRDKEDSYNIGSIELFDQIINNNLHYELTIEDKKAILGGKIITTSAWNCVIPAFGNISTGENATCLLFKFNDFLYEMYVGWDESSCYISGFLSKKQRVNWQPDKQLSMTSENTVQNKVITEELEKKVNKDEIATPDWNAKEGESGYIKNRTHYFQPMRKVSELAWDIDNSSNPRKAIINLSPNYVYKFEYEGNTYYFKTDGHKDETTKLFEGGVFTITLKCVDDKYSLEIEHHTQDLTSDFIALYGDSISGASSLRNLLQLHEMFIPDSIARSEDLDELQSTLLDETGALWENVERVDGELAKKAEVHIIMNIDGFDDIINEGNDDTPMRDADVDAILSGKLIAAESPMNGYVLADEVYYEEPHNNTRMGFIVFHYKENEIKVVFDLTNKVYLGSESYKKAIVQKDYVDGKLTELSEGIALRNVGAEDTDESVDEPEIGGGGMTTPSGDPMHYMFEAVGATYNATDADIPMVGVYGDSYVHKAKHWHLNELGDITNEEMRQIYLYANLDNGAKAINKYLTSIGTRTNIVTWSSTLSGKIKDQEVFSYAPNVIVARMRDKEHYIDTNASYAFIGCTALQKILPTLDATSTTSFNGIFDSCNNLREVRIKNVKVAIKFKYSPLISKASILYLIQNSSATSAMVITLHADAYARLAEDADIVAALAEKTNVSLAK